METKLFEIRDRMTFIPALAVRLKSDTEKERWLLARTGFGMSTEEQGTYVIVMKLASSPADMHATYDEHSWPMARTMPVAHRYIREHWFDLVTGDLIDVEYILGETTTPKESEMSQDLRLLE